MRGVAQSPIYIARILAIAARYSAEAKLRFAIDEHERGLVAIEVAMDHWAVALALLSDAYPLSRASLIYTITSAISDRDFARREVHSRVRKEVEAWSS